MKNFTTSLTLSALALAVLSTAAQADPYYPAAKTLEQSQAEYVAARDRGELPTGYAAISQRDMFHGNAAGSAGPLSVAAVQPGTTPLGFVARTERDVAPGNFAQERSALTRAQVRADEIAASKSGELPIGFVARSSHELFPAKQPRDGSSDNVAAVKSTTTR